MTAVEVAGWWAFLVRTQALYGWRWLPGPWPVKLVLIGLYAAGQYIPFEFDEILLTLLIVAIKRRLDTREASRPVRSTGLCCQVWNTTPGGRHDVPRRR